MGPTSADLAALAEEYGVSTSYEDWQGRIVDVDPDVVSAVLGALGVDASDPATALRTRREEQASRLAPATVVTDEGVGCEVVLHGEGVQVSVLLEDATTLDLGRHSSQVTLPADLPLGWHTLRVDSGDRVEVSTLIVAPPRLGFPAGTERLWGWAVQLYQVRSARSWGMGDYGDLATIAAWSGRAGAGAVLVNPLHAVAPTLPVNPSPYYPWSRRFRSAVYLRPEQTPEYAAADEPVRARIDELAAGRMATNHADSIDRDAVWAAKLEALESLFAGRQRSGRRADAFTAFCEEAGQGLTDFATFCVIAERHGLPWQSWPQPLRRPDSPAVAQIRAEESDRVTFHAWLQFLCDEQLADAQDAARAAGMPLGVIHDLAVGVDMCGADAWALQDALAVAATIGAPPDSFNQVGQDWRLPPWRPNRLAEVGYAPYRDMLRAVLRHAGGVRIDHVMGLFRMWWIPEGEPPERGTYVQYDDRALLGVLLLEAHRAGALVVGEDLGTVEKRVQDELRERRILGSDVLWFAREYDEDSGEDLGIKPPEQWRELALASITTHDLPTVAGWLAGEHVRVRAERGLLGRPVEEEQAQAERERREWIALLRSTGLLPPGPGDPTAEEFVVALHAALGRSPARIVLASLADAVADRRQPNLPGTLDEYPNWRLPVADGAGRPLLLEDVMASPLATRIAACLGRVADRRTPSDTVSTSRPDQTREQ